MDHCSQPGLLPLADALLRIQAAITPLVEQEQVDLPYALDRILATAIHSSIAVPGHDNAAMDGYALRYADLALDKPLRVIGQALAGHAFSGTLGENECVRIMTGAPLPAGADTVVMQENTLRSHDEHINLTALPRLYDNIRRAGEDIALGTEVFPQGHRLTPVDIGLLASLGIASLRVYRKLRVAVLATGDELTPPGQPLAAGQIYDSNRYALMSLLQKLNIHCIDLGLIADQPEAIAAAFNRGAAVADAVISSGGVSVGDADYTREVLTRIGEIDFWKIAIKPGKPFAFGKLVNPGKADIADQAIGNSAPQVQAPCYFFGLPGNPVSAVITYHQLVLPALRQLAGEIFQPAPSLIAITSHALKKQPGRIDFQRGIAYSEKGINYVSSTGNQSSGVLSSVAKANCYIVLAQESGAIAAGDAVQIIMFDRFLR